MALHLQVPQQPDEFRPRICVVGIGGAGGNAINNMIASGLEGVEFLVCNTDAQDLAQSLSDNRLQLGPTITKGLGAGMQPQVGAQAAEESMEEILHRLDGANMVFITAGMGGGTGTGAAPVIAQALRERNILTVGVVTKPFQFEGLKRAAFADEGLASLSEAVDTLIVIPNQNLFRLANEKTTFADAFKMADNVLLDGVRGVSDLIVKPGIVNLDFADVRTLMTVMGKAMMGTGESDGETRALEAAERAIANPLLDDMSLDGAQGVLINVTGGFDITLYEVDAVANHVREKVDPDANIIFGSSVDESMTGSLRVSVVATGIDADQMQPRMTAGSPGTPGQPTPPMRPGGGPTGGPGGGMPQPAPSAQPAPPPMSPFGRSPFPFRSGNNNQGPTSQQRQNNQPGQNQPIQNQPGQNSQGAHAPASAPQAAASQATNPQATAPRGGGPQPAAAAPAPAPRAPHTPAPEVSHNYTNVPPARSNTAEAREERTRAPFLPLDYAASANTPAPNTPPFGGAVVKEEPAATAPMTQGLFGHVAPPRPPAAPAHNSDTPASQYHGGAAVAAANASMREIGEQDASALRAVAPAPLEDLDAPASPAEGHSEPLEQGQGPRVVNIDDSANSGLEHFDRSYRSVPAFWRLNNN